MNEPVREQDRSNFVCRILSAITVVHPHEVRRTLLLVIVFFLLFSAYYILKPIREALLLPEDGGAAIKRYAGGIQALLFIGIVPAYSALAQRFSGRKMLVFVYTFLISNLFVFMFLGSTGFKNMGIAYFLWLGIFNLFSISQTWSLCNDLHTLEQGKRLFPLIFLGCGLGSVFGSGVLYPAFSGRSFVVGMGIASVLLLLCALIVIFITPSNFPPIIQEEKKDRPTWKMLTGGLGMVFKNKYILLIASLIFLMNMINTTSEYMLDKLASQYAHSQVEAGLAGGLTVKQFIGQFYSKFYFWVNSLSLFLQFFVVSRVIKHMGIKIALLALPVLALFSYSIILLVPFLPVIRFIKIAENASDYSLNNTAKEILYLPLSREEKYKAKFAADTCFCRAGDAMSAMAVLLIAEIAGLGISAFATLNLGLVFVWLVIIREIFKKQNPPI